MKAHEITPIDRRQTRRAWRRSLVLVVAGCSLVVPSIAGAIDRYTPASLVEREHDAFGTPARASQGSPFERTPTELGQTTGKFRESLSFGQTDGNDSSEGRPGDAGPTVGRSPGAGGDHLVLRRDGSKAVPFVPWLNGGPPAKADDGSEWAVGVAAGMGLVVLGGALFLTLRRRTSMPTSASTS